jgi:hypothetical protein
VSSGSGRDCALTLSMALRWKRRDVLHCHRSSQCGGNGRQEKSARLGEEKNVTGRKSLSIDSAWNWGVARGMTATQASLSSTMRRALER